MSTIVLFDGLCPLCRTFASILRSDLPPGWQVIARHEYIKEAGSAQRLQQSLGAEELQILSGDELLQGEAAWAYLIEHAPQFRAYQNIAARLGLTAPRRARVLMFFGSALRGLCPLCPHHRFSSNRRQRNPLGND